MTAKRPLAFDFIAASDPVCIPARNHRMLTQDVETAPTAGGTVPPAVLVQYGRRCVSAKSDQTTEQTRLMLAVRDARCKTSFAALFDHFAPRLKGFVIRAGASHAEADEIVQDVLGSLSGVRPTSSIRTAHRCRHGFTRLHAIARLTSRERNVAPCRKCSNKSLKRTPTPARIMALEQESARIRSALTTLSDDQRDIIERAYIGELTHQQISTETGLPLGTIKSRIRLGLERLRHELKDLKA